jgi:hypothetical protein
VHSSRPEFTQHGLKISGDWDFFKKVRDNGKQVLLALKSFGKPGPGGR